MIVLGLLSLEFTFIWTIERPILVSKAPIICLVFDLLGVFFVLGLLLVPLFFSHTETV